VRTLKCRGSRTQARKRIPETTNGDTALFPSTAWCCPRPGEPCRPLCAFPPAPLLFLPLESSSTLYRCFLVVRNMASSTRFSHSSGRPSVTTGLAKGRYSPSGEVMPTLTVCLRSSPGRCMSSFLMPGKGVARTGEGVWVGVQGNGICRIDRLEDSGRGRGRRRGREKHTNLLPIPHLTA
jgi:hypothetical protein